MASSSITLANGIGNGYERTKSQHKRCMIRGAEVGTELRLVRSAQEGS
jgi:hypothetical protein